MALRYTCCSYVKAVAMQFKNRASGELVQTGLRMKRRWELGYY